MNEAETPFFIEAEEKFVNTAPFVNIGITPIGLRFFEEFFQLLVEVSDASR